MFEVLANLLGGKTVCVFDVDMVFTLTSIRLNLDGLAGDGEGALLDQFGHSLRRFEPCQRIYAVAIGTIAPIPHLNIIHQLTILLRQGLFDGGLDLLEVGGPTAIRKIIEVDGVGRREFRVVLHISRLLNIWR